MVITGRIRAKGEWLGGFRLEQLVIVRPYKGGLSMHQVFYADEVRSMDDVDRPSNNVNFKPVEEELADRLIAQLSSDCFDASKYHDDYRERVFRAVEQKVAGQEITIAPEQPQAQIIDLFEALKRSLATPTAANAVASDAKVETTKAMPMKKASPKA